MILEIMLNALVVISSFHWQGAGFGFGNVVILDTATQSRGVEERTVLITARNMKYAATLNNKSLRNPILSWWLYAFRR
ncbi:hypothetical protein [Vibrio sp. 10N.286.48.B7]|uniref:hypothetical protein n=1 Tax=Vibrio sp. 10N.286.48.B7 TaxID=1880853 RepID=UPI0039A61C29